MYKQTNINIMHSRIVNKTRYDDSWKPIKQTSFIVKNLGKNLPKKQFTIIKRSFRSSTKLLSLNSTILIDKLIVETFYRFRISELFNIWMLHPQSQLEPPTDFKNLLKVFLHCSKSMVVAMTLASSPTEFSDLLWNYLVWGNRENLVTKP